MGIKLLSVKDGHGKFTGYYTCSACDTQFKPHPLKPEAMHQEFTSHVMSQHHGSTREEVKAGNHVI
jgi:uncharacterized CHY-type Zn-finger protein